MIIGIIGAMASEVEHILKSLDNKQEHNIFGIKIYEGKIGIHTIIVSQSGVGKVNSAINTTLLINNFHPDSLKLISNPLDQRNF